MLQRLTLTDEKSLIRIELLGQFDGDEYTICATTFCHEDGACSKTASMSMDFLPIEVITLIVHSLDLESAIHLAMSNKALRQTTVKGIDDLAKDEIEERHPWMLPHTPREIAYWNACRAQQEQRSRLYYDLSSPSIRWLSHMKACLTDPTDSVRNRRRVWKAAAAIFAKAEEGNHLECA